MKPETLYIATRGSALALAQANTVLKLCRDAFPKKQFELKIIRTTGDKLQTASLANPDQSLPKGLFTKEIEDALLAGEASIAVHSLKDLPTELPEKLALGAVLKRADPRDVLIYRDAKAVAAKEAAASSEDWTPGQAKARGFKANLTIRQLPEGATIATSSTRRAAQIKALRPDIQTVLIRGNVPTRIQKLAESTEFDATILAAAGLARLGLIIWRDGTLRFGPHKPAGVPEFTLPAGVLASPVDVTDMIPCVGQAAIGLEVREDDATGVEVCNKLNHGNTLRAVLAERAFLRALGGGCQSPVGAHAEILGHRLVLKAVSFQNGPAQFGELSGLPTAPLQLGEQLAATMKSA